MNMLNRMKQELKASAMAGAFAMAMGHGAWAQETEACSCLLPPGPAGQPLGSIESFEGQVQVSQAAGFSGATEGMSLVRGTQIIVGPQSQAVLDLGANCRRTIGENRDVVLDPLDDNICVRIIDSTTGEVAGTGTGNIGTGIAVAAGIGGIIALIADSVSD